MSKINDHDPSLYAVSELFWTVQGEGFYAGAPALFVRLQGCDVGCAWCDTKHSWPVPEANADSSLDYDPLKRIDAGNPPGGWRWMWAKEIGAAAGVRASPMLAVVTGGEPAMHNLGALARELHERGFIVCIETSGTHSLEGLDTDEAWVTVSPKVGMAGGREVRPDVLAVADEVKMPVGKQADIDRLEELLQHTMPSAIVSLQPLSMSRKATELCIETALQTGWRVSVQQHRYLQIR